MNLQEKIMTKKIYLERKLFYEVPIFEILEIDIWIWMNERTIAILSDVNKPFQLFWEKL